MVVSYAVICCFGEVFVDYKLPQSVSFSDLFSFTLCSTCTGYMQIIIEGYLYCSEYHSVRTFYLLNTVIDFNNSITILGF
jgi:hypothetical protein